MALYTIQELLTELTPDQVRANMVTALVALGVPADKWRKGGTYSTLLAIIATTFAGLTTLMVDAIGAGFLNTAAGPWLQLLAYYVYGVTVPPATFASGPLTFVNSGGGIYNYPAGQITILDPITKKTFVNAEALALGATSTQTIQISATEAGAASSAPPGEINTLVTGLLGVTVSNATAIVGLDQLSDDAIRILCTNKLGAMSVRGPRTAYAYAASVATNPITGAPVNINRTSVSSDSHTGIVTVVVASPSGAPDAEDVLGVIASIEAIARPEAVTVNVSGAVPEPDTDAITVWAENAPGADATTIASQVGDALAAFFSTYPVGGLSKGGVSALWGSGVEAQCRSANATIFAVDGANDLALLPGQVAVDEITITVRLV